MAALCEGESEKRRSGARGNEREMRNRATGSDAGALGLGLGGPAGKDGSREAGLGWASLFLSFLREK